MQQLWVRRHVWPFALLDKVWHRQIKQITASALIIVRMMASQICASAFLLFVPV
jgi:hypothetical protein